MNSLPFQRVLTQVSARYGGTGPPTVSFACFKRFMVAAYQSPVLHRAFGIGAGRALIFLSTTGILTSRWAERTVLPIVARP
jgi:hypothetical protein